MSCTDKEEDHIRNLSFSEKSPGTVTLFWETNLSSVEVFISEDLDFTTILHDTITSVSYTHLTLPTILLV